MNETISRIHGIIRKLQAQTTERGCTPAEAATAAAKIQELLEKYQVSLVDISASGEATLSETLKEVKLATGRKTRNPGEGALASAIASGCDVKMIHTHVYTEGRRERGFAFLGFDSDVEVVQYLYTYLVRELTKSASYEGRMAGYSKASLVQYRNNYLCGAAGEIRKRLLEERRSRHKQEEETCRSGPSAETEADRPKPKVTGTALVAIKEPAVKDFVKKQYPRLTTLYSHCKTNCNGLNAGRRAGRNIALRPAVNAQHNQRLGVS